MTPRLAGRCPKCGGNFCRDGSEIKCLQCGDEWKSKQERSQFYELHKDLIIEDFRRGGAGALVKRWGIPEGSIGKLLSRWQVERPGKRLLHGADKRSAAAAEPGGDELPAAETPPVPQDEDKLVTELAEARIEIAYLRGYQQASRDYMLAKK